jgi:hypothetical protein
VTVVDSLLRPVGPASPATYWRRRAIVLAVVVLLSYLVVRTCSVGSNADHGAQPTGNGQPAASTPGSSDTSAGGEESESSRPTSSAEPTGEQESPGTGEESPGAGQSQTPAAAASVLGGGGGLRPGYCVDDNVRLDVRPGKRSYSIGEKPVFALSFFNVGEGPCKFEIGPVGWRIDVESGGEHIWSTDDCSNDEDSDVVTLQRLAPVTVNVSWDRGRSKPGCPTGAGTASPGTYTVSAAAGEVTSPEAVFVLVEP